MSSALRRAALLGLVLSALLPSVFLEGQQADQGERALAGRTATRLADGRVLLVGGRTGPGRFEPPRIVEAGASEPAVISDLPALKRLGHTATLLADGRVLVVGGQGEDGRAALPAVFEPDSNAFATLSIDGLVERVDHAATLLVDGAILFAGGVDTGGADVSSVQVWNPDSLELRTLQTRVRVGRLGRATLAADSTVRLERRDGQRVGRVRSGRRSYRACERWRLARSRGHNRRWLESTTGCDRRKFDDSPQSALLGSVQRGHDKR